jgi:hypothetical protein
MASSAPPPRHHGADADPRPPGTPGSRAGPLGRPSEILVARAPAGPRAGHRPEAASASSDGRTVVMARVGVGHHRGALTRADGATIAGAARMALDLRLPLVLVMSSSGSDVNDGIAALHGWGEAAAAVVACSGPGPGARRRHRPGHLRAGLLLGLADLSVMTPDAFAFLSGPDAVEGFTGIRVSPARPRRLGHARHRQRPVRPDGPRRRPMCSISSVPCSPISPTTPTPSRPGSGPTTRPNGRCPSCAR